MAYYDFADRKVKRVSYDLSDIEVGESIYSFFGDSYYLCVKAERRWDIYKFENGQADNIGTEAVPTNYIYPFNYVFDAEKTKWVVKMWNDTIKAQSKISDFKYKLRFGFNW